MKRKFKLICTLSLAAAISGTCGIITAFADDGTSYYVCYSTENYSVRNANKMYEEDGEYYLKNVTLSSLVDFYVTDGAGRRWYNYDGKELSISSDDAQNAAYNIKFSPEKVYDEDTADGWEVTYCNITYGSYVPAQYFVNISGEEIELEYNQYHTSFDEYYISSYEIKGVTEVVYNEEVHTIEYDGFYRILFTPGDTRNGNDYAYNDKGEYGTGSEYKYNLYIEDAPQYYLAPEGVNDESGYFALSRYENNTTVKEYRTAEEQKFFISERDYTYSYRVYEKNLNGTFRLIDDDNDDETAVSKITVSAVGNYVFSFVDGGQVFSTSCVYVKSNFKGFYVAGEFNGYCYDSAGNVDKDDKYLFKKLEDGDDDYDKDYDQYVLYLNVSEKSLKDGDVEFYITDGENSYKNGTDYIKISRAGEYKILFSDEHFYGNGRRYRYVLLSEDAVYTELEIGTAQEFIDFAKKCTESSDYSRNLAVYLTADIDFVNVDFVSVGEFSGKFYGGYHTLKNINLDKDTPSVIELLKRDGSIERLNIQNINLTDKEADYAGVIGKNYGTVSNVAVYGKITGNNYVGAVVAYNGRSAENESTGSTDTNTLYRYGIIKNCKNYAEVSGTVHCGGICGFNAGEISFCENNAPVTFKKQSSSSTYFNLGGVSGYSAGKITACENKGEIIGGNEVLYVGGISGLCTGEVYYSFNYAKVGGRRYSGGICGYYGTLSNNDDKNFLGGLSYEDIYDRYFKTDDGDFEQASGRNQIIKYCINYGNIASVSYSGGIVGYTDSAPLKISCCESTGYIHASAGSYAGGIAAYSTGARIESCIAAGTVFAEGLNAGQYVGGIAGYGNNISVCSSVCELIGNDYIGGIAGYNQSGLSSCWANVNIIISSETGKADNAGNIAGFTESLNEGADNFAAGFENNFYIENSTRIYGGIHGRSYEKDYAACPIKSEELAYKGVVSPYLSEGFNVGAKWQGSANTAYPVPVYLVEAEECDEFDDEEEFLRLFGIYGEKISASALENSQILYTVSFLEWNEDKGSDFEDTGNYETISTIRLPLGAAISLPEFKWAYLDGGKYVYDGNDASYFVTFVLETDVVDGNRTVYAHYREIAKTISTGNDKILVEGEFDVDTRVELVSSVNGYSLKFTLNGEEIKVGEVKVKFLPDGGVSSSKIQVISSDGTLSDVSSVSGNYLSFAYSDGEYFTVITQDRQAVLPSWAWALIGGLIGAVIVAAGFLTPVIIKKIKSKKKAQPEHTAQD